MSSAPPKRNKYHFLGKPAPAGYVAGVARGDTGFVTRSDIGPAIPLSGQDPLLAGDDADGPLFISAPSSSADAAEDMEADRIYANIESRLKERRRRSTTITSTPTIKEQFEDLKRGISTISSEEWEAIPDIVGDMRTRSTRRQRLRLQNEEEVVKPDDRLTPIPDFIIERAISSTQFTTTAEADGTLTDLAMLGAARERQLGKTIDVLGSSGGTTTASAISPDAYLTGLESMPLQSTGEIRDLAKAKVLLRSLVENHPSSISGWLSLIRLNEGSGEIEVARQEAKRALSFCSRSEELWGEAARIAPSSTERASILRDGLKILPRSPKLWLRLADAEVEDMVLSDAQKYSRKLQVLREGLAIIKDSVELWRAALDASRALDLCGIETSGVSSETRALLEAATASLPSVPEFWIGMAEIQQTQETSRAILNKARATCPLSHEIWIASACIEEVRYSNTAIIPMLLKRMLDTLKNRGHVLSSERWLQTAVECEVSGAIVTAANIVTLILKTAMSHQESITEAEKMAAQGHMATARSLIQGLVSVLVDSSSEEGLEDVWVSAVSWAYRHDPMLVRELLDAACRAFPSSEQFWLMAAKDMWVKGEASAALTLLTEAIKVIGEDNAGEELFLAVAKIHRYQGSVEAARDILAQARRLLGSTSSRVWIKSAQLERAVGNLEETIKLLSTACSQVSSDPRLWLMLAETLEKMGSRQEEARRVLAEGRTLHPTSAPLWIAASRLEPSILKARAILEYGRIQLPRSDVLWLESIRVEMTAGNKTMAKALLSKALQSIPTSGLLWSEAIRMESKMARKTKAADALRKAPDDAVVALALARVFWEEMAASDKIKTWIERSIALSPLFGDAHAYAVLFERCFGDRNNADNKQESAVDRCLRMEPKYGEIWISVSKDPISNGGVIPLSIAQILDIAVQKVKVQLGLND